MRFEFDWDPAKAESNRRKHGVGFEDAMGVFADPLALSRPDEEAGQGEERWVTIGRNPASNLLLVVHTWIELSADWTAIRIISARQPTRREIRQYEEG
ncbi:MAG: BrnT family toxin [Alphaproteobacteria bacterium]|nr:BrnT family toxin [Alphaproteobacteria bacterium]